MSLISVAAAKGSPGVTTTALALAAVWPRPAVLAECDVAGSDLALRLRDEHGGWLPRDRGLLELASRLSVEGTADVRSFAQQTEPGVEVLLAPPSATHADALRPAWPDIAEVLAATSNCDVICDCGRITPIAGVTPVLLASDLILLVARPTPESVAHTRSTLRLLAKELADLETAVPDVAVIVVAAHESQAEQVGEALMDDGLPDCVLATVAADPGAAAAVYARPTRGLDRSRLLVSVRNLAVLADEQLAERATTSTLPEPAAAPRAPEADMEVVA